MVPAEPILCPVGWFMIGQRSWYTMGRLVLSSWCRFSLWSQIISLVLMDLIKMRRSVFSVSKTLWRFCLVLGSDDASEQQDARTHGSFLCPLGSAHLPRHTWGPRWWCSGCLAGASAEPSRWCSPTPVPVKKHTRRSQSSDLWSLLSLWLLFIYVFWSSCLSKIKC